MELLESTGIEIDKADCRAQILSIRDQVFAMGNNDMEGGRFDDIFDKLDSSIISGPEAIEEANMILNSKIVR